MVNTQPSDPAFDAVVSWDHLYQTWRYAMLDNQRAGDVALMNEYLKATGLAQQYIDYYRAHPRYVAGEGSKEGGDRAAPGGAQQHVNPMQGRSGLPTMATVYRWAIQNGATEPPDGGNLDLWQMIVDGDAEKNGVLFYAPDFSTPAKGGGKLAAGATKAPAPAAAGSHDVIRDLAASLFGQRLMGVGPLAFQGNGDDREANGYNPYDDAREGGGSLNARWVRNNPIRSGLQKVGSADTAEHYKNAASGPVDLGGAHQSTGGSNIPANWNVARMPGSYERPDGSIGDVVMDEQTGPGGYYATNVTPTGAGTTGGGGTTKRI